MRHDKSLSLLALSIATALGYQIGLYQDKSAAPRVQASVPRAVELMRIGGGEFVMGDTLDGMKNAPPHRVVLSPFWIAKTEVTLETWDKITLWGRSHGYPDLPLGNGKRHDHPVYGIAWGDAIKWCNAFSEYEGLAPCYHIDAAKLQVARKGIADVGNQHVKWDATGYRLPTEAEWEFAARGGVPGKRFPSGDTLSHQYASYHGSTGLGYDAGGINGTLPSLTGTLPHTAPVGSFQPNGFGLHDMAGNVAEWCWDFYDPTYGTNVPLVKDPHGPDAGSTCVVRGGSWRHTAAEARCASRFDLPGDRPTPHVGLRIVRRK